MFLDFAISPYNFESWSSPEKPTQFSEKPTRFPEKLTRFPEKWGFLEYALDLSKIQLDCPFKPWEIESKMI